MLLRRTAWAPIAVLIAHQVLSRSAYRQPLDFAMHFSGGVAIAYFLYHALGLFGPVFGEVRAAGRYLFSFALACMIGLFWEFAELFSDVFLKTRIQRTIAETMRDLIADTTGAALSLSLIGIVSVVLRRRHTQARRQAARTSSSRV
ncbi:MAG TPA: hypothetical protein VK993_16825 [Chthoniobacterales bacterium]|nr:hypothetical protein [Chthoniobacterales bacterium]